MGRREEIRNIKQNKGQAVNHCLLSSCVNKSSFVLTNPFLFSLRLSGATVSV
uniref:Uncharacterized protein n=1 Tax=Anguilla anguilla TaxID=7936 RepID=A0A0E9Y2J0_ANGAN